MSARPLRWAGICCRFLGRGLGPVPGWYMILIDPWARRLSHEVIAVSVGGAPMRLDLAEFVQRKHYFRSFERRELRFLRRHLGPGDTFVDVGANVGILTVEAARVVGRGGFILAIEPVPTNAARLRSNASFAAGQVTVLETAVGASRGTLTLSVTAQQRDVGNMGSYSAGVRGQSGVDVPVECLDDIIEAEYDTHAPVHLLKIDVEGMEGAVVRGAVRSLSSGRIRAVMFERNISLGDSTDVVDVLRTHGFVIRRLGLGGRLRPTSTAGPGSAHRRVAASGLFSSSVAWVRGDARLETLVATIPISDRRDL